MKKFWNWMKNEDTGATELYFEGPISACLLYTSDAADD